MITLIRGGILDVKQKANLKAYGITGEQLCILGKTCKDIIVAREIFDVEFHVLRGYKHTI